MIASTTEARKIVPDDDGGSNNGIQPKNFSRKVCTGFTYGARIC